MRINADNQSAGEGLGTWDHTAVIAGVEVPLLPPREAERDPGESRARGLIGLPGLLWRWLRVLLVGRDAAATLRAQARCLVPGTHAGLIDRADLGTLSEIVVAYRGLQDAYYAEILQRTRHEATRASVESMLAERAGDTGGSASGAKEQADGEASSTPAARERRTKGVPIRPNEPLPHAMARAGGHAGPVSFGVGGDRRDDVGPSEEATR